MGCTVRYTTFKTIPKTISSETFDEQCKTAHARQLSDPNDVFNARITKTPDDSCSTYIRSVIDLERMRGNFAKARQIELTQCSSKKPWSVFYKSVPSDSFQGSLRCAEKHEDLEAFQQCDAEKDKIVPLASSRGLSSNDPS